MKTSLLLTVLLTLALNAFGQKEHLMYTSKFETADTSFTIRLKLTERHGLWRLQCYQHLNSRINTAYISNAVRDTTQAFFISKITPIIDPKIVARLHFGEIETFNEHPVEITDSSKINPFDDSKCDRVRYDLQCYFLFSDSLWFPLRLYVNQEGELMHQSSIVETLTALNSYELPSITEIYRKVSNHRKFREYPVSNSFHLYYSEKRKLFYYEFIANNGKVIENTRTSLTRKMNHVFVDAFTGKILWKPTLVHIDKQGGCTTSKQIKMPKNRLTQNY